MKFTISIEQPEHAGGVDLVERAAFGREGEARLVETLRESGVTSLSLVALVGKQVIGHVLFTPMRFNPPVDDPKIAGLGPVAVLPDFQAQGVGSRLIEAGLEAMRQDGVAAVFLLGSPAYYSRFGFVPASRYDLRCAYEVPGDAFQVIELVEGSLAGRQGTVYYHPEFDKV